jgi:hypothetical protein
VSDGANRSNILSPRAVHGLEALVRHVLVLLALGLLLGTNGCVLTSAVNYIGEPGYPEQTATIAAVRSNAVGSEIDVLVRTKVGQREQLSHVWVKDEDPAGLHVEVRELATQSIAPSTIDLFGNPYIHEIEVVNGKNQLIGDVSWIQDEPGSAAKFFSAVLLVPAFLVDVATFPIEWIGTGIAWKIGR